MDQCCKRCKEKYCSICEKQAMPKAYPEYELSKSDDPKWKNFCKCRKSTGISWVEVC